MNCSVSDTSAVSPCAAGGDARAISEVFCVSLFSVGFAEVAALGVSLFFEVSRAGSEWPPKSFMVKASQLERGADKLKTVNINAAVRSRYFLLIFNFLYISDLLINIINP